MRFFPKHTLTRHAIGHYEYHVFTKQVTGQGPDEIKKRKWNLIQKYPSAEFAREEASAITSSPMGKRWTGNSG